MIKATVRIGALAVFVASVAAAQTFDTREEAWGLAVRNGVTVDEWDLVHVDSEQAAFVRKTWEPDSSVWIALFDTEDMTVTFGLSQIDCQNRTWGARQGAVRTWSGELVRTSEPEAPSYVVPGSVGEKVLIAACSVTGLRAPPPITLPIEPTRKEDRVYYNGPPVIVPGPPRN